MSQILLVKGRKIKQQQQQRSDLTYIEMRVRVELYLPVQGGETEEVQSGWHSFYCGYIIVILNLVTSSLSYYSGVGQIGKHGKSTLGIIGMHYWCKVWKEDIAPAASCR